MADDHGSERAADGTESGGPKGGNANGGPTEDTASDSAAVRPSSGEHNERGGGDPGDASLGAHERFGAEDAERDLPGPLLDVLSDPEEGRHRLPYLLGLLEGDNPQERLVAGTAIALVVETHPDLVDYAVERLVDRLGEDSQLEVAHTLDYLAARHTREVDEAVSDLTAAAEERARRNMYQTGGGFARSEYLSPSIGDRPVGRTRIAGNSSSGDPRRTYTSTDGDREELAAVADAAEPDEEADESADNEAEPPPGAADVVGEDDPGRGVTSGTLQLVSRRLSAILEESRFDDLSVLAERRRGRHGDVYRSTGAIGGNAYAVGLTVYRLPDTDRETFIGGFRPAMDQWAEVNDHENIRSVYDWDVRPRPWAALEYTAVTLADRTGVKEPLWTAIRLIDAIAHAHQQGVVHGALDPGNVVYRDDALIESERQEPLLDNIGLAAATGTASPGQGVDPRYAAPEHYDDRFGRLDHATDIYSLGTLLYRLATDQHPYRGDREAVRDQVLAEDPLEPTAVDPDLPAALDRVVGKATAARKLKRYETINTLAGELRAMRDG
jgi:hypothetical protein